jgi:8-oxo-dGTP pyrophosphatase MutT (NUDIX family)
MVEHRPVLRHDRMVCFDDGADRFHMRAAGIAIRNGRVLVQNLSGDPTTFLPGGRIEQGEATTETLVREMQEEFGHTVSAGPLLFVIESFFTQDSRPFHEVAFYFDMPVGGDFPYHDSEICHRCHEGSVEMEYRWIETTPMALAAWNFVPNPLRTRLGALPTETVHLLDGRQT